MSTTTSALRKLDWNRIVFDLVLVAFFAIIVIAALGLRPGAQMVPLLIGVPALIGMVIQTISDVLKGLRRTEASAVAEPEQSEFPQVETTTAATATLDQLVAESKAADETEELESIGHGTSIRRQLIFVLWAAGFVIVAMILNAVLPAPFGMRTYFLPVAFVALVAIFRYIKIRWLPNLLMSGILIAGLYVMLVVLLQVRF